MIDFFLLFFTIEWGLISKLLKIKLLFIDWLIMQYDFQASKQRENYSITKIYLCC